MRIDVATGEQLTTEQAACWSQLQRVDPALRSPFFRPEYTRAVAGVHGGVEVAILRDGDETVGFFPYERRGRKARPVGGALCDFQGIVARKGLALDARELLRGCGLTAWRFDHLITAQALFQPYHCVVADSPYLDISRGYEAYLAEQREKGSHTIPKTLQKARKLARELAAPLRFEPHTTDRRVLAKLIDWKQQQYAQLKDVNYLAPRWTKMLLESVVDMRDEAFSGMLSALYVGERLAAVHLGIRSYDVLHAWFPTYDPALANYSPGLILWVELLQACPALHIGRIDLGKGQQRFKTSLMSAAEPVAEGTVDLRRMQASIRRTWLHARDWIRATPLRAPARVPARMLRRFQAWLTTH